MGGSSDRPLDRAAFIREPLPIDAELRRLFPALDARVVLDIGSCEGEDAIRYARLFPSAQVLAFEPLPENVRLIRENLARHPDLNIRIFPVALSDTVGTSRFFVSSGQPVAASPGNWDYGNKSSSLLPPAMHREVHPWVQFDREIDVPTETLERVCRQEGISHVDVMHIDVQGAELTVLRGAGDLLRDVRVIWMEVEAIALYEGQPLKPDVERFMAEHGFRCILDTVGSVSGDQLYVNRRLVRRHDANPRLDRQRSVWRVVRKVLKQVKRQVLRVGATSSRRTQAFRAPMVGTGNQQTRDEWVRRQLSNLPAGWRILDAGAGEQPYRTACSHLEYVSQDLAEYEGVGAVGLQPGAWDVSAVDIVSDVASIPVADASFDAALCTEVLEHTPDPIAVVRELARIVRPGGVLLLTAPFASLTHQAPYHFSTGFGRAWYEHHLPAVGFDIIEMSPNGNFFQFVAQELRRTPDVARRYDRGVRPSRRDQVALAGSLRAMDRLDVADSGSSELLCFGWHVRARRAGRVDDVA